MAADTIAGLLAMAQGRLAAASDAPRLEAEVLLAHSLGRPRSHLHAWPQRQPEATYIEAFASLLARRQAGEPLAYILGRREFWSLDLVVTPAVLIPRPDTEGLVELALQALAGDARVADLGTGSGAIALAIASQRPDARIIATDHSRKALAVARCNARRLGISNVRFRRGDWCRALDGHFDLIAANPPYVADADPHLRQGDLRFEPREALAAGADGLAAIRRIAAGTMAHLRPGGRLLLEHGYDQGEPVAALLKGHGYESVTIHRDAAGRPRVAEGRRPAG